MTDPVMSPDGKFMWIGSEWVPAPPSSGGANITMQDSVIGGDVVNNTVINNDPSSVTAAVITALQQMGMINTPQQHAPPISEVELPQSFNIGDHVEYNSPTNRRWLNRCKVLAVNDDGTYKIEVPKDSQIEIKHAVVIGTSPGTIRPSSIPYNIGDRVFVNWKNYGHFYAGKIASENQDNTFLIHFDDGDVEDNVEWGRIEPLNESSEEVQAYISQDSEAENELIEAFKIFDVSNSGTIPAKEYLRILTETGDDPIPVEDVMNEFSELGIDLNSQIDYRELAKYLVGSDMMANAESLKPEVVIRDASINDGKLKGYAYAHPKLGETWINSTNIKSISYDERATSRVETRNTIYVVGPTGWAIKPENHPFNKPSFSAGQQVKVEWNGSWWDALIRDKKSGETNGSLFLIHYVGFDSSWDEWVDASRMKTV